MEGNIPAKSELAAEGLGIHAGRTISSLELDADDEQGQDGQENRNRPHEAVRNDFPPPVLEGFGIVGAVTRLVEIFHRLFIAAGPERGLSEAGIRDVGVAVQRQDSPPFLRLQLILVLIVVGGCPVETARVGGGRIRRHRVFRPVQH